MFQFKLRKSIVVVLLAALALTAGCGRVKEAELEENPTVAPTQAGLAEVSVDKSANGAQVQLEPGQTLVITLDSNPSTGYSWGVAELDGNVLQQVREAEFQSSSSGEVVGAGGQEIFRFKAANAGSTTLKMGYRRPWETDVEPVETFTLQVTAGGDAGN